MSGRRLSRRRIKGPVFDSFLHQNGGLKKVLVWAPNTQSTRQCKKNLRIKAKAIIDSTDPQIISVGDRVIRAVCGEPDPEYSALHLFCAALDAADQTGETWTTCMLYMLDKFETMLKEDRDSIVAPFAEMGDARDAAPAEGNHTGSRLRGLLRSLIPRSLRARDETAPKADEHQRVSDADGQRSTSEGHDTAIRDYQGPNAPAEDHPGRLQARRETRS